MAQSTSHLAISDLILSQEKLGTLPAASGKSLVDLSRWWKSYAEAGSPLTSHRWQPRSVLMRLMARRLAFVRYAPRSFGRLIARSCSCWARACLFAS